MSSTDERVVSLKFDNQQFESGVKTSLGTLDQLKQGLKLEKAADGLNGLKTATKGFDMGGVSSAVEAVTSKFSILGTIGDQVLRNLTSSAMNLGRNLLTAIPKQIIEGGKRRAQNIEQAQFQLKGLMGSEYDWNKISEDLDYAVAGTAYGLDAAAKVASQLKASNIDFGDDMKGALRGISGVAAMTNSSYEDIGHIFTTIAGQGKLMTDQLNQFAGRGLNVAAELAKAYNVDEATLREMVTKGKVDFKTFAEAMDNAFGDHATKANETFDGALSNIKASMSRMGQKFATPIYDNLRDIFNKLLPLMKGFEKLLNPLAASFEKFAKSISAPIENGLEAVSNRLQAYLEKAGLVPKANDNVAKSAETTTKALGDLNEVAMQVISGKFGNGDARKKALEELGFTYEDVQKRVNELLNSTEEYEKAKQKDSNSDEKSIKKTNEFKKNIDDLKDSEMDYYQWSQKNPSLFKKYGEMDKELDSFSSSANKSKDASVGLLDKLATSVAGVAAAVSIVSRTGKALVHSIIKPFMSFAIPKVLGGILTITSGIGSKLVALNDSLSKSHSIEQFFAKIHLAGIRAKDSLSNIGSDLLGYFDRIANLPGVERMVDAFNTLKSAISESLANRVNALGEGFSFLKDQISSIPAESILTPIANAINWITDTVGVLFEHLSKLKDLPGIQHLADSLSKLKTVLWDVLTSGLSAIGELLGKVGTGFDAFPKESFFSKIDSAINFIADALANVIDVVTGGADAMTGFFSPFTSATFEIISGIFGLLKSGVGIISSIAGGFINGFGDSIPRVLENVRTVIGNLWESFKGLLSNVSRQDITTAFGVAGLLMIFESLSRKVSFFVSYIKRVFSQGGPLDTFKMFFKNLNTIIKESDKRKSLFGAFNDFFFNLQNGIKVDVVKKTAIAIAILAGALFVLASIPVDKLGAAVVAIVILMQQMNGIVGTFTTIAKTGGNTGFMQIGAGLTLIAIAVLLLASAAKKLADLSWEELARGLTGVIGLLIAVTSATKMIQTQSTGMIRAAAAVILLGIALKTMVGSVASLGTMDVQTLVKGIVSIFALLSELSLVMSMMSESKKAISSAVSLVIIGIALKQFLESIQVLGEMDIKSLLQGVFAIGGLLLELSLVMVMMSAVKGSIANAVALVILGKALSDFIKAISDIGGMDLNTLVQGVGGLAALLLVLAGGMSAMTGALPGAAALIIVTAALSFLVPVLKSLGEMSIGSIIKSLLTLAGVFIILGVAGAVLGILSPLMLAASAAMLLMGASVALLGAGVIMLSIGLASLGASAAAGVAGLMFAIEAFILGLANSAAAIAQGAAIIANAFLDGLLSVVPNLINTGAALLMALLTGIANNIGPIAMTALAIVLEIINVFTTMLPAFIQTGIDLMVGFMNGLANGIRDNTDALLYAIQNLFSSMIEFVLAALADLAGDIPVVGDKIASALDGTRQKMADHFSKEEGKQVTKEYTSGMTQGVTSGKGEYTKALNEYTKTTDKSGKEISKYGELYGDKFMQEQAKGFQDGSASASSAAERSVNDIIDKAKSAASGKGTEIADNTYEELLSGFQNGSGEVSPEISSQLEELMKNGASDADIESFFKELGYDVPEGLANGVSENSSVASEATGEMADESINEARSRYDSHSPSKVFEEIGSGIPEGTAKGINKSTPMVKVAVTKMAMDSIKAIQTVIPQFARAGVAMGSSLASGLRAASGAVRSAASSLGSAAKSGVGDVYNAMRSKGQDAGAGYARGIRDKIPEIRSAAKAASDAGRIKMAKSDDSHSPSRKYRKLGHYAMDGYILGFRDRIKNIGAVATTASRAGIDATKGALKSMSDAISGNMDLDPTIKPVLDLTDIKNSAGMINSLLPNGSVGLGLAVAGTAPGATYRMTNEDVVSAINGLRNDLVNNPQTVNNYSMGDVTYDDGTNVATAVRSLIRAARTERRV